MTAVAADRALTGLAERARARVVADASGPPAMAQIIAAVRAEAPLLSRSVEQTVVAEVWAAMCGLGPLEPLLADPAVSDVLVNGDGRVWVERAGMLADTTLVLRPSEVGRLLERIVAPLGLRIDRSSPLVDARLPDGSRVHAVVPPLAVDGPCLAIRRFGTDAIALREFAPGAAVAFLTRAVAGKANLVIAGGTGSGKTTLLNALAACIPPGERVITIEDTAELSLRQPHLVRLESRPANAEGAGRVTTRELVRNALRMRPDRIVVGECRGGEALDMLQAMNTGHEGSLTTCHANGLEDTLRRLETMVLMGEVALPLAAVRSQLCSALDLVVHVVRAANGGRCISAIGEVVENPVDGAPRICTVWTPTDGDVGALRRRRLRGASRREVGA